MIFALFCTSGESLLNKMSECRTIIMCLHCPNQQLSGEIFLPNMKRQHIIYFTFKLSSPSHTSESLREDEPSGRLGPGFDRAAKSGIAKRRTWD